MLRSKDDEIKRLKEELWFARTTIIDLVPAPFCEFFRGYYHCNTRSEGYEWRRNLVAEIIENTPVDDQENFGFQRTTRCPLCDDSPSHFYRDGFTFPEGLRRHLTGFGNTNQCSVMREVYALVRDYWNDKFSEQEELEREEEHRLKQERMKTETLYITEPFGTPELVDSSSYSRKDSRNEEGILWAEERLKTMGFSAVVDDRVRTHTKEYDDFIVYADLRMNKKIDFEVYSKPLPKRRPSRGVYKYRVGCFTFQDSWKHGLPEKFEKRINDIRERKQR